MENIIAEYYQRCFGEDLPVSVEYSNLMSDKESNFKEKLRQH